LTETGAAVEGPAALATLLVLSSGRVRIEKIDEPAVANVMSTVDVALGLADTEDAPIAPSLLPEPLSLPPSAAPPAALARAPATKRWRVPAAWREVPLAWWRARAPGVRQALETLPGRAWTSRRALALGGGVLLASIVAVLLLARSAPSAPPSVAHLVASTRRSVAAVAEKFRAATPPPKPSALLAWPEERNVDAAPCEELLGPDAPRGRNPGAALEQLMLGRKELVRGHMRESLIHYCRAHVWDPDNTMVLLELGRVVLMQGDGVRARVYADRALALAPQNEHVLRLSGDVLARNGRPDAARAALLRASGASDKPGVHQALARGELADAAAAYRRQDYETSERLYRRAAALDPSSAPAAAGVARSLLQQSEATAALSWAQHAASLAADDADVQVALGDALAKTGSLEGAQAAWRAATLIDPNHRAAQRRLRQ
jgi:tetratricopeptide (TPR) repeat protein